MERLIAPMPGPPSCASRSARVRRAIRSSSRRPTGSEALLKRCGGEAASSATPSGSSDGSIAVMRLAAARNEGFASSGQTRRCRGRLSEL